MLNRYIRQSRIVAKIVNIAHSLISSTFIYTSCVKDLTLSYLTAITTIAYSTTEMISVTGTGVGGGVGVGVEDKESVLSTTGVGLGVTSAGAAGVALALQRQALEWTPEGLHPQWADKIQGNGSAKRQRRKEVRNKQRVCIVQLEKNNVVMSKDRVMLVVAAVLMGRHCYDL